MGLVTKARLMQQGESERERVIERLAKHSKCHRYKGNGRAIGGMIHVGDLAYGDLSLAVGTPNLVSRVG